MYKDLQALSDTSQSIAYVFCAGFEQRVMRAPTLLAESGAVGDSALILGYAGDENDGNLRALRGAVRGLSRKPVMEATTSDVAAIKSFLSNLDASSRILVIDITGMSRVVMMGVLSTAYDLGLKTNLIYTEAAEYYPEKAHFDALVRDANSTPEESFLRLNEYEQKEIVYSMNCDVEEVEGLNGRMLPNYPLMLIAFLTFKRGRVSSILQAYEANHRILIKSVPVRDDLKWRAQAIEIPNLDLLEDSVIAEIETLSWSATYDYLVRLYENNHNRYKFNFLMAPLGSKMQTVGAWLFAKERRDVKVVTSTPRKIFHERYSVGYGQTFLVDDLPIGRAGRPRY